MLSSPGWPNCTDFEFCNAIRHFRAAGNSPATVGQTEAPVLQQIVALEFLQRFDDFANSLRMIARGYQQGVRRVHHDQIPDPQERHHFSAGIHEIVVRIQADGAGGGDVAAGVAGKQLVDRVPDRLPRGLGSRCGPDLSLADV